MPLLIDCLLSIRLEVSSRLLVVMFGGPVSYTQG